MRLFYFTRALQQCPQLSFMTKEKRMNLISGWLSKSSPKTMGIYSSTLPGNPGNITVQSLTVSELFYKLTNQPTNPPRNKAMRPKAKV